MSFTELAGMLAANGCLCVAAELPGYGASACGAGVFQDNDTRAQILWGILDEVERRRGEKQCVWHLIGHGSAAAAIAAEVRGFNLRTRGSGFKEYPFSGIDFAAMGIAAALLVVAILLGVLL